MADLFDAPESPRLPITALVLAAEDVDLEADPDDADGASAEPDQSAAPAP